ncbi:MAG: hypothetical protein ACOH17_13370 [Cellulomonas sp.]
MPTTEQSHRGGSESLLLDLAAHRPVRLTSTDVELVVWVNNRPTVLDPDSEPGAATPAQAVLDWCCEHLGINHATDGDRAVNLASAVTRHVLPFLIE